MEQTTTKHTHNRRLSIVKGIGIILIVIGHASEWIYPYYFVYLFHVMIFFFVSGYFFNDKDIEQPLSFFKKKIMRLYFPWVFYGIIFVLLHNFFLRTQLISIDFVKQVKIQPYDLHDIGVKIAEVLVFYWKEPLLAPLWFLFALFVSLCLFYAASYLSLRYGRSKAERFRCLLIIGITVTGFIGVYHPIAHINFIFRSMIICGFMYIGKLYAIFEHRIRLHPLIALVCFFGLGVVAYLKYQINIGALVFGNLFLFFSISIAGCYLTLTLAKQIDLRFEKLSHILDRVGKNTLSIMILHYTSFKLITFLQIIIYHYPSKFLSAYPIIHHHHTEIWWIPYTLIGIYSPLLLSFCYDKIKGKMSRT